MIRTLVSTELSTKFCTAAIALLAGMGLFYPQTVNAKEVPETIQTEQLRNLARDFVSRIGGKLKAHDQALSGMESDALSVIPDGEFLLLRPKSGKFIMNAEIGAIPNKGAVYYSFEDLITYLELQIDYNPETKIGSGWFLREDWLIRFDFNKKEVVARNTAYTIGENDTLEDGGEIFISDKAAAEWMNINLKADIVQQYVEVNSAYPYPALARNAREREINGRRRDNAAILPRAEDEDRNFDINVVETQQTLRMRRDPEDGSNTIHQNTTSAAGEILGHNAYGVASWDSEKQLHSIRGRLTKESEDPTLLGPLKARSYTLGDTDLPQLPLTGGTSQELGVRVNNNPLRNADFQRTTISGDSLPGWDIELYRDGFLIDRIRVEEDARYEFPDIDLFAGDNLFDVYFYGPQGEIRKDSFNIPVNEQFLATQDHTYDMALTFKEAQTYSKFPSDDEDANSPHLVARYNKIIGNTLGYAGLRARKIDGEQKAYLGTGFTNIWNGYVFDGNAALDEKANKALELTTRKNIDDWRLQLTGSLADEDFKREDGENATLGILGTVNRNFITPFDTRLSFTTAGEYKEFGDETTRTQGRIGFSHQMGRLTLSNFTQYTKNENEGGNITSDETRVDNTFAARVSRGRFFTTAGVNYNIRPDSEVDNYFGQVSYYPTSRLSSDLTVAYDPKKTLTEARATVNYRHDKFRISPYVDVDSDSNVETGMRLSSTFIDRPNSTLPIMTSKKIIGRGLVSSFVFYDKNGNNIFDEGDEPLPDVYVESVNISRREPTDDKGYSLIKDLPEKFATDIRIDQSSLPDPFMIPGFKGASVFPKSGEMINLSFPVHLGGEIDGTVYFDNDGALSNAGNIPVQLIPLNGSTDVMKAYAAADGYFVMSSVPPGDYVLSIDAGIANKQKAGGMPPTLVRIGYDGTVLSGQDIKLEKGRIQVPLDVKTVPMQNETAPFFALQTGSKTKSGLSSLLQKMVSLKTAFNPDQGLVPVKIEGEDNIKVFPGKGLEEHYSRCQTMNDAHLPCRLVLFVPTENPNIKTAQK